VALEQLAYDGEHGGELRLSGGSTGGSHACPPLADFSLSAARHKLPLLDPQLRRELGIVAAHLLDEALRVLAPNDVSSSTPSGKSGERARRSN
jgi:hypothetical protein